MAQHATVQRILRSWIRRNHDLIDRLERAHPIVRNGDIAYDVDMRCWYVQSSDGSTYYAVNLANRACQCPDNAEEKAPRGWCKHLLSLAILGQADAWEFKHRPGDTASVPTRAARTWAGLIGQPIVVRTAEVAA